MGKGVVGLMAFVVRGSVDSVCGSLGVDSVGWAFGSVKIS